MAFYPEQAQDQPGVYAITIEITVDSQTVRNRYEAPTAEEVIRLAELAGETFDKPHIVNSPPS
jgi:hypothetical protein